MSIVLALRAESAYPITAASPRVRLASWARFLPAHGIELRFRPTLTVAEYERIGSDASFALKAGALVRAGLRLWREPPAEDEVILVHRLRFLANCPPLERQRVDAYDLDDAIFLGQRTRSGPLRTGPGRAIHYMKRAGLVLAGNSYLADFARQHARRVEILPTVIDPSRYATSYRQSDVPLRVGWIGSRTTTVYLEEIFPVLERLHRRRPGAFRLVMIGARPTLAAPWLEFIPWSLSDESESLASLDVGVM